MFVTCCYVIFASLQFLTPTSRCGLSWRRRCKGVPAVPCSGGRTSTPSAKTLSQVSERHGWLTLAPTMAKAHFFHWIDFLLIFRFSMFFSASEPNLKVRLALKQKMIERRSSPLMRRKEKTLVRRNSPLASEFIERRRKKRKIQS